MISTSQVSTAEQCGKGNTAQPASIASDNIYKNGGYLANNQNWHADDSPWKAQHILHILRRNGCSFETVTEVGCGAGKILEILQRTFSNRSFTGFDISPQAASLWPSTAGNTPSSEENAESVQYRLEDFLAVEDCFDLLLLIDVFEHVPDYIGFLKQLQPRAQQFVFHIPLDMNMLMTIKNEHTELRNRIGHLHYFAKETALATLKDCGYKTVDWFYTADHELPGHERRINPLRKVLFRLNPDLAVSLLGGWSMMVLAEPTTACN
ncbi:MAG: class I SAM-dependent methyltransferase [Cyanobacteria bacterium J06560_2]